MLGERLRRHDAAHRFYLDVALDAPARDMSPPPRPAMRRSAPALARVDRAPSPAEEGALLLGTQAIGDYLGMTARQVKHAVAIGSLPVFRMGRLIRTSKPVLDAWIRESATAQRTAP